MDLEQYNNIASFATDDYGIHKYLKETKTKVKPMKSFNIYFS